MESGVAVSNVYRAALFDRVSALFCFVSIGVGGGVDAVGAAMGEAPDEDAGFGLVEMPALGLFRAVMAPAERFHATFARSPALVVRDGVVVITAGGGAAAARKRACAVADVEHVAEAEGGPVPGRLPVVGAVADGEWPDRHGERPSGP